MASESIAHEAEGRMGYWLEPIRARGTLTLTLTLATSLQNELNSGVLRFTTHIKPALEHEHAIRKICHIKKKVSVS